MSGKKVLALAGFVILGLAPSFVDWQESPEKRVHMVIFYVAALVLIYLGIVEE